MTMPYHITVGKQVSRDESHLITSIIQNTFQEVDQTVNNWNPSSEISSINRSAANTSQKISTHLRQLLLLSEKITTLSEGRFDPTIDPLTKLWKNALGQGTEPDTNELNAVRDAIGWNHVHLEEDIVWKDNQKTALDLCAISKGYCIDLIVERLKTAGFNDLFVEWAGEIRTMGKHPSGRHWTVQIEPNKQQMSLIDGAIATSGDYAQTEWGQNYFHIIDPKSCKPMSKKAGSITATTVIAPTCALADSLATTLMTFQTKEEAECWAKGVVKQFPEVSFWIFTR